MRRFTLTRRPGRRSKDHNGRRRPTRSLPTCGSSASPILRDRLDPSPGPVAALVSWDAGRGASAPLGAFDRARPATQPPPPPGLTEALPTWASAAATRRCAALAAAAGPGLSSSVASDGAWLYRIALKVVPVDEQKTPWLATADLRAGPRPSSSCGPTRRARSRPHAPRQAQAAKRNAQARNAATIVGSRCDRATAAAFAEAGGQRRRGARRAPKDAHGQCRLLAGRDVDATADDTPETRQNLGWAELVATPKHTGSRRIRCICCNHLSRAFERDFGSALVETLFGDYESLAALLRAPQLKDVVTLVEQPGRPDLMVRLAQTETPERAQPAVREALRSLGLERYEATFAREDVSVQTLVRMTDDDLAALGLPKGPRVQILAWASR